MPAKKPVALIDKDHHQATADRAERTSAEATFLPQTELSRTPPLALRGHISARQHWKMLIGLYGEVEGVIATAFDQNLLIKYCLILEECDWLMGIRTKIEKSYTSANTKLTKLKTDDLENYYKALSQVNALLTRLQGFDARLDGKRKLALALEQSLYLTPRSRAGVAPPEKEHEPEPTETEKALGQ
jgi:hypothetical protein